MSSMLRKFLSLLHLVGHGELLAVGSKAPRFEAFDHTGARVRLADFVGRTVVLWFYPKADTPG